MKISIDTIKVLIIFLGISVIFNAPCASLVLSTKGLMKYQLTLFKPKGTREKRIMITYSRTINTCHIALRGYSVNTRDLKSKSTVIIKAEEFEPRIMGSLKLCSVPERREIVFSVSTKLAYEAAKRITVYTPVKGVLLYKVMTLNTRKCKTGWCASQSYPIGQVPH